MPTYYAELIQTDPDDSPSPGCGHYAGELAGFPTPEAALAAGAVLVGGPAGDAFDPCCRWQRAETIITGIIVYREEDDGTRMESESWPVSE